MTPNWLRLGQRVRIVGSFASYDGRADRRVGRKGVIWRLCSPVFADHTYVYLDPVGAERAEKIAQVELRDVSPHPNRTPSRSPSPSLSRALLCPRSCAGG